jgi:hypothetical protein
MGSLLGLAITSNPLKLHNYIASHSEGLIVCLRLVPRCLLSPFSCFIHVAVILSLVSHMINIAPSHRTKSIKSHNVFSQLIKAAFTHMSATSPTFVVWEGGL